MKIEALVQEFLSSFELCGPCTQEFEVMHSLKECIEIACRSTTIRGRRHSHQNRIPFHVLQRLENALMSKQLDIEKASDFEALHSIVDYACLHVFGAGSLLAYDVALRMGQGFLNLEPTLVYLHSGAREGATHLGVTGRKVSMMEFPSAMHALTPAQAEDFLCRYKSQLAKVDRSFG
jgi:hypothetical protein